MITNHTHLKQILAVPETQHCKGVCFIITKITMRLVKTLTKTEQQFQLQTHLEYSCNDQMEKENPEKTEVLRDTELLESWVQD